MTPLPRSSPSQQQVDPAAVHAFLDAMDARDDIEMHSLMVVKHGHVVAEGWWSPYSPERVHLLYSLSKSFTSTAAAFAQQEGLLDLDDTLVSHFPEIDADITDPRSREIRLRHVAAMASGHTREMVDDAFERDLEEPVRGFLLHPPPQTPGTVFAYNQPCTYSLAAVVQRRAGTTLTEYLRPRLFDPLGIDEVGWASYPRGRELGFTGLHARTEDIAKLGLLHLQRGRWGDDQLIPEAWVDEATRSQVDNPHEPNPDWRQGYGFQFWMSQHGYRGDGAFGQFCLVLPEQDAVVATTCATEEMQAVLDAVWEHLLPGLSYGGVAGDEASLAARLSELHLPAPLAEASPADWEPWTSGPFTVTPGMTIARAPSHLTTVQVQGGDEGWEVVLQEARNSIAVPVGTGSWTVSEPPDWKGNAIPVAAAGGWLDAHTLRVEVIFLETPHRLDLTLSLASRSAAAVWSFKPLAGDRIADLHSP